MNRRGVNSVREYEIKTLFSEHYNVVIVGEWAIFGIKDRFNYVYIYCLCEYKNTYTQPYLLDKQCLINCWGEDIEFIERYNRKCNRCHSPVPRNVRLIAKLIQVKS